MASGLYTNYKDRMLGKTAAAHGLAAWETSTIKCGIVSGSDYTENLATDQDWDNVGTYTLDACYNSEATQTLANAAVTAGVVDNTADITFTAVAIDAAKVVDALVHYLSTGVITTDALLVFHDGFTPVTPNGGDIVVAYHASGLFAL